MKRKILPGCLLLILCLLLGACGAPGQPASTSADAPTAQVLPSPSPRPSAAVVPQTTQSPKEQTGYAYVPEWRELELDGMPEQLFYLGDRLLLAAALDQGGKAVYDPETGDLLPLDIDGIQTVAPGDGVLWCGAMENGSLTLHALSPETGAETASMTLEEQNLPYSMAVDGSGCVYLLSQTQGEGQVTVYSGEGKRLSVFSLGQEQGVSLTAMEDGSVILSSRDAQGHGAVKRVDTEGIGPSMTGGESVYRAYGKWPGQALLSDGGSLYALELETNTMTSVLDWIDTDVNPEELVSVASQRPELICLVAGSSDGVRLGLLKRMPAEPEQKTVISVGLYADPELVSAVNALAVETNLSASDYRIHVVNYRNYTDGTQRLVRDSKELDLVIAEEQIMDQLELLDLGTLMDDEVGEKTLVPCLWKALRAEEAIDILPLYFTVDTLVGRGEVLGADQGWTPKELADAAAKHPDALLFQMRNAYDSGDLLMAAWQYITDEASILEALQSIPVDEGALMEHKANLSADSAGAMMDGSLLLEPVRIRSFADLRVWNAALEGDLVLRGYPVNEGNGSLLVTDGAGIGLPAGTEQTDRVWGFVKALLQDSGAQRFIQDQGFPILQDQLSELEENARAGLTYEDESGQKASTGGWMTLNGKRYETEPLTVEQAKEFRECLEGLSGLRDTSGTGIQAEQDKAQSLRAALRAVLEEGLTPAKAAETLR